MTSSLKVTLPVTVTVSARLDATSLAPDAGSKLRASLGASVSQNVWTVWGTDDSSVVFGGVPAAGGVYNCGTLGPSGTQDQGAASVEVPAYSYYFFQLPVVVDAIATEACIAGVVDAGNPAGGGSVSAALVIANKATGGVLGTAAATVDSYLAANLTQTTAGQTVWPPDPTNTAADHFFELGNTGSVAVTVASSSAATKSRSVQPNDQVRLTWQGAGEGWAFSGAFANGGNRTGAAMVIGTTDAQDLNFIANGANTLALLANGDVGLGDGAGGATSNVQSAGSGGIRLVSSLGGVSVDSAGGAARAARALDIKSTSKVLSVPEMNAGQFAAIAGGPPHLGIASITDQDTTGQLVVNVGTAANPAKGICGAQHGRATLVAGTTALIPAHVSATSTITPSMETPVPGAGSLTRCYAALAVDRVVGELGAGGGFKLTALIDAGTINVLDLSTLGWTIDG